MCSAVEETLQAHNRTEEVIIKWPNDILINDKKVITLEVNVSDTEWRLVDLWCPYRDRARCCAGRHRV